MAGRGGAEAELKKTGSVVATTMISEDPNVELKDLREYELKDLREYGIIFISARFDGGPREHEARDLKDELIKIGLDARMVKAAVGRSFGDDTNNYLPVYSMKTMIAL